MTVSWGGGIPKNVLSRAGTNKIDATEEIPLQDDSRASGWRRYRRRPLVVGWVGVLLVLLGCLSIAGAPFILILEQIHAGPGTNRAPIPWIMLGGQIAFSAAFVYLGSQILKGKAWARLAFIAFGVFALIISFAVFKALYVLPGVFIYGLFTALLFQRKANRFF